MPLKRKSKDKTNQPQIFENSSDVFEGRRYFKDPKKISEHLICGICQDVYDEPWSLTCGHTFCMKCITGWLKSNNTCPVDRSIVSKPHCHKNIPLANIIGDLMIACSWRPYGCNRIDRYYLVKDHIEKCAFNPNKMDPVMQAQIRKAGIITSPVVVKTPTTARMNPTTTQSALDELMGQLENGDLDESLVDDDVGALPELEVPSLAMRMYMKQESMESKNIILHLLDSTTAARSGSDVANGDQTEKGKPKKARKQ